MQQDQALQDLITKYGLPKDPLYFGYEKGSGEYGYVILLDDCLIISSGSESNKMAYSDIKVVEQYTSDYVEVYFGHFIIVTTSNERLKINLQRNNHTPFNDSGVRLSIMDKVDIAVAIADPSRDMGITAATEINRVNAQKFIIVETVFRRTLKQHGVKFVENTQIRSLGFALYVWAGYSLLCLTLLGGAAACLMIIFNPFHTNSSNIELDSTMIIVLAMTAIGCLVGFVIWLRKLIKNIQKQFKK